MSTTYQTTAQGRNVRTVLPIEQGRRIEIVTSLIRVPELRTTATVWRIGADGRARHAIRLAHHGDYNKLLLASAPTWALDQLLNVVHACLFEQMPSVRGEVARHYAELPRGGANDEDTFVVVRDADEVTVTVDARYDPATGWDRS